MQYIDDADFQIRIDDDQGANKTHANGGPAAGANSFFQDQRRQGSQHQWLHKEDRQGIGDGQVFQRAEEKERGRDQKAGAQGVDAWLIWHQPAPARVAGGKGQGQKGPKGQPRPDDLHHGHALLAQELGQDVNAGQNRHGGQHQGDAL